MTQHRAVPMGPWLISWKVVKVWFRAAPLRTMTPSAFHFRLSFCYALMLLGTGVQMPFLPLWLSAKGLSLGAIGIILAAMTAVRIVVVPVVARLADARGNRLSLIRFSAAAALLAYGALTLTSGFWPILAVAVVASLLFGPVFPLAESFAVDGAAAHGLDYGRIRLWASLSFLAGNLGAGALLTVLPAEATVYLLAAAQGLAVLAAWLLPGDVTGPRASPMPTQSGGPTLLGHGFFALFVATVALAQSSHAVLYSFASVQWQAQGFSRLAVGGLWAVGVLAEVTLFAVAGRALVRVGILRMLMIGIAGGALRWLALAAAPALVVATGLQLLHAASFATVHLATMHYIRAMVPQHLRNTAQGLYSGAMGAAMALMTWAAGPLYAGLGPHAYLVMAGVSLVALGLALRLARLSPTEPEAAAA